MAEEKITQVPPPSLNLSLSDLEKITNTADFQNQPVELKRWLFEQRVQYAWNFFDFHAKQRMTMFNYFLILVGFVISACASLLKDGNCLVSSLLSIAAALLTIIFIFLERRNEELVNIAEDLLGSLECDALFDGYNCSVLWPHRRGWLGWMTKTREVKPAGIFRRQKAEDAQFGPSKYEHGKWLPRFQWAIVVIFVGLTILPWAHKDFTIRGHILHINSGTCK